MAICARRGDRLADVPASFRYVVDVADPSALEVFAAGVERDLGGVDVLINNAGASRRRTMSSITMAEFTETVDVNFWSAVRLTHHLLPGMIERKTGTIVNVSSMGTRIIAVRTGAYTAAKAALNHYTEGLFFDLAGTGVHAKLFIPGSTATEFSEPKEGNDAPFPVDPSKLMTADAVAQVLIDGIDSDHFEYYADPTFAKQTSQKFADHNAFLIAMRKLVSPS